MAQDLEHARQPNQLITVICLDCGDPDDETVVGVKRFMTETGRCATCGSDSILKLGAVKELKRRLHLQAMRKIEEKKEKRERRRRERRRRRSHSPR